MENEKKSGDKYSKLAGNTLIFAISSFSSKLLTLIVQPFLTYAMAEISDLGLSKILSQYANLLIPFVSMGMSNAIIRFGLDKGNSEKQVFTNGLLTILGGFGILVLCWPIAQFLPDMAQYGLLIYIYVLMSCLRTLCTQFVRSRQWNKLVAVDGVLCTVATMAFYVLYLVGFKWGANGYLLAIISGDLSSVLFLMFTGKLWNYVELKGINKDLWKQMLRFSLPMIPAQISFWIINASDLFFVRGAGRFHCGKRAAAAAHTGDHAGAVLLVLRAFAPAGQYAGHGAGPCEQAAGHWHGKPRPWLACGRCHGAAGYLFGAVHPVGHHRHHRRQPECAQRYGDEQQSLLQNLQSLQPFPVKGFA